MFWFFLLEIILPDFLSENKPFLDKVVKNLEVPIDHNHPSILREQIVATFSSLNKVSIWKAQAEKQYRIAQGDVDIPSDRKSKGREYLVNSETAHYRYQRDMFLELQATINAKLQAMKSILNSLYKEGIE